MAGRVLGTLELRLVESSMTDKKKRRIREHAANTGMSYQASCNAIYARSEGPVDYPERRRVFRTMCLTDWAQVVRPLLGGADRRVWTSPEEIVEVLKTVGAKAPQNHCFYPRGGGLDLSGAEMSRGEPRCIVLKLQGTHVLVRPDELELLAPEGDTLGEWTYFRLGCAVLAPSGVYEADDDFKYEELVELSPGKYLERSAWDNDFYVNASGNKVSWPATARTLSRYFEGAFLLFPKASAFNAINTYDGKHSKVSAEEFARHIRAVVKQLHSEGLYGKDPRA